MGGRDGTVLNRTHAGSRMFPKAVSGQGLLGSRETAQGLLSWAVWVDRCLAALREVTTRMEKRPLNVQG